MANKTVVLSNYFLNGTANLTLLLLNPTNGNIGNGSGDTLTAGSNGLFSAVVTEAITGWWNVVVLDGSTVLAEGGKVYFQSDSVGTYIVDDATHAADAVLDEAYADHNLAGTIGKLLNTIRKSNLAIEGVVSNAITPTTVTFSSNVAATTSAYAHAVLLFVSGPLAGENSPIISYTSTNGVFVLEEPLTAAPSNGDEFVVIAGSHVHAIQDIADAIDITVAPLQAVSPNRVAGTEIVTYINDVSAIGPVVVTDSNGNAVDLSALTLKVCIEKVDGTILANVTPTVSGAGNNQVTFTPNADSVAKTGTYRWSLRETSSKTVYALGDFVVDPAARLS